MVKKTASSNLESFAEDLGKILGTAENKARGWLDQRKSIAQQLTTVRDKADELLRELTGGAAKISAAVKNTAKKSGRRKFTAAQRKEQGDRMRAYWANRRATAKTTGKKSGRRKRKATDGQVGNG